MRRVESEPSKNFDPEVEEIEIPVGVDVVNGRNPRNSEYAKKTVKIELKKEPKIIFDKEGNPFELKKFIKEISSYYKLGLSHPLFNLNKENPAEYEKVLEAAEKVVIQSDSKSLFDLMHDSIIHPTVLRRLLEKYIDDKKTTEDSYIKVQDALGQWDSIRQSE